jgi:hypothetical protein
MEQHDDSPCFRLFLGTGNSKRDRGEEQSSTRHSKMDSVILIETSRKTLIILHIVDQCLSADDPKKEVEIDLGTSLGPCSSGGMLVLVDKLIRKSDGRSPGFPQLFMGLSNL